MATKTGEREGSAARAELERSLERMGVDSVDLIQLHNLVEADEWEQAFAPNGAVASLFSAREEGLCRHIGITCHGQHSAAMHLRSLSRANFTSVLLPYNHMQLEGDQQHFSWYEPIDDIGIATRSIHFVLANPQLFLNTSSDARLLELTCDAAESFKGMGPDPKQLANDRLTHSMAPIFDSPAPR